MPRVTHETYSIDDDVHILPDPCFVYRLFLSHGYDACVERWSWMKEARVGRIIQKGRRIVEGRARRAAAGEAVCEMQTMDARIVRITEELANVETAIRELGISRERILAAFDRLDRVPPRAKVRPSDDALRTAFHDGLSVKQTAALLGSSAQTVRLYWDRLGLDLEARKAALRLQKLALDFAISVDAEAGVSKPAPTVTELIGDLAEGLGPAAIARKRGIPLARVTRIFRMNRIPGVFSYA